ncbi:MAG: helix-turn-helix domain-containing protein [Oscillospiraceae bacterium]|nr:helix-turn-helix domain-containing protein [Oscillospiraceae bacterium]
MNNIRNARKSKGLTGEQLGSLVGVQKSAISKYERDEIQPSKDVLLAMANVLSVTTDYLLGRTNNPTQTETEKTATDDGDGLTDAQRELIDKVMKMDDHADIRALLIAAEAIIARRDDDNSQQ